MLFKLPNLNSNLALTMGYLNPALNNSAQDSTANSLLISIFHKLLYSGIPYIRQTLLKLETVMPHLRYKRLSL